MAKKIIDIEETIFDLERISGGITCGLESLDEQLVSFGKICCEYELEMDAHSVESLEKCMMLTKIMSIIIDRILKIY